MTFRRSLATSVGGFAFVGLALLFAVSLQHVGDLVKNPFGFSSRVTPSGATVLMQVQKLARLETCRFNGQATVKGETTSGVLPTFIAGDRLVFIGQGEVVAGVDLSKMQAQDVEISGESARLHLPPAEIFHVRLDNAQSEVFERQTGWFSQPDRDLETRTRLEAENRLREAALQNGLLETARQNAQEAAKKQLELLGVKDVTFVA